MFGDPTDEKVVEFEINKHCLHEVNRIKRNFWWFATIASLNHALNYVVTSYATSLLDTSLGGVILGLNWFLNAVSGLTVATPIVRRFGFKISMLIAFWGYTFQIATLYYAIVYPNYAWPISLAGGVIAGFTSAIWWTAQGVCFELTCVEIEKAFAIPLYGKQSIIEHVRADLSAHWTIIYQVADILVFLSLTAIPILGSVTVTIVLLGLTALGVITSILGHTIDSLGDNPIEISWSDLSASVIAVPVQFKRDARVSLLAPFVFGFGITTAMFAYFVNATLISDASDLGAVLLGVLEAFSYFVAVVSAYPYAYIANKFVRGQEFVIQFGSLAFLLSGVVVFALSDDQLSSWGAILSVKMLYGLGRGVFEGSCRAVYAQLFTGKDLSTAFSGQTLLAGFSGGICFFMFRILNKDSIAAITVINGVVALIAYGVLMSLGSLAESPVSWSKLCSASWLRPIQEDHDYTQLYDSSSENNYEFSSERKFSEGTASISNPKFVTVHNVIENGNNFEM